MAAGSFGGALGSDVVCVREAPGGGDRSCLCGLIWTFMGVAGECGDGITSGIARTAVAIGTVRTAIGAGLESAAVRFKLHPEAAPET